MLGVLTCVQSGGWVSDLVSILVGRLTIRQSCGLSVKFVGGVGGVWSDLRGCCGELMGKVIGC